MEVLFGLLVGLAVLAAVGHGLWVAGRALLGALRRLVSPGGPRPIEAAMCPRCGEAWDRRIGPRRCPACSWPAAVVGEDRDRDRAAVDLLARRLQRLRQAGLLLRAEGDRIAQALVAERQRLEAAPAEEAHAVVPEPFTPAPAIAPEAREAPTPRLDVAARALAYREAKAEDRSAPPEPETEPEAAGPRHRAGLGGLLAAFMEERNIRWGELVGGLLIVGCSLALVVGYWERIAERPILRFGLANGAVAAFFAVGLYADRRWRLPTTARGLLAIATLLVPLSVLAIVSARGAAGVGPLLLGGELLAMAGFAALIGRAGRSIGSTAPWATAAGVSAASASILMAGRWAMPGVGGPTLAAIGAVPLLAHAAATLRVVLAHRRRAELDEPAADDLIRTLGLTAFAAAVALGAVLHRVGATAGVLRPIALLAPLAGVPALAAGLVLWRRAAPPLVGHRVAGGSIAAGGTLLMLAGVALSWPEPSGIVAVAALDGVVLLAVALAFDLPAALALAGGCLAVAGLVASLVVAGPLTWTGADGALMAGALTSARGGAALVPIALLFEAVAAAVLRAGRRGEARAVALVSGLAGLVAIGLVSWHGLGVTGDPDGVTWAYAALAAAALAGAAVTARLPLSDGDGPPVEAPALAWAGSALMLAALVQGFVFRAGPSWGLTLPWSSALLGHATIAVGLAATAFGRRADAIGRVLFRSAFATSAIAAVGLAWRVPVAELDDLAVHLLWLAGVWLALAWRAGSPALFGAFQAAATGSVVFGVASWLGGRPWFGEASGPWLDPRVLQAEGIALALLGLGWVGVRVGARALAGARPKAGRVAEARRLLEPPWPAFDRLTTWAAVLSLVILAAYGAVPGAAQELSPRGVADRLAGIAGTIGGRPVPPASAFEVPGIPHRPATGAGSWLLLAAALLTLLAGQWERFRRLDLLGAMLVAAMAVPLAAARWEPDVAVASALRWGGAIGLLALSVPVWARGPLAGFARTIGWPIGPDRLDGLGERAIGLLVAMAALPMVAMVAFVAVSALNVRPIEAGLVGLWQSAAALFVLLAGAGLGSIAIVGGGGDGGASGRAGAGRVAGGLLISLGTLALVAVSALVVGASLAGNPIVGPAPGSFFDRIGLGGSYAPPILLVALTLVGHAIRERSSALALAAGLLLGLGATVGSLLSGAVAARPLDPMLWVRVAQVNAIVGSAYALAWMVGLAAIRRRSPEGPAPGGTALVVQVALPTALVGLVLIVGVVGLLGSPWPSPARGAIADPAGWAAFGLVAGAVALLARRSGRPTSAGLAAPGALAAAAMLAFGTAGRDSGDWLTYHAMLTALAAAVGGLLLIGWSRPGLRPAAPGERGRSAITRWSAVATAAVALFALRAYESDPVDPIGWTVGGLVAASALGAALAGWSAGRGFLYGAGILLNLAAALGWIGTPGGRGVDPSVDFLVVNLVALTLPVPAWLWIELRAIRPARDLDPRAGAAPFHRVAAWVAVAVLAVVVLCWVLGDATGGWRGPTPGPGMVATIAAMAVALAAGFWDERSRSEVAGLYLLGLCAAGWVVAGFDLPPAMLGWIGAVVLACYAVIAAALWSARSGFRRLGDRLGVPRSGIADDPDLGLGWLVPANVGLSAAVVTLGFAVVLTDPDLLPRFSAAKAGLATALAVGLLARGERRSALRATALGFGAAGALAWGWAWIAPDSATAPLDRAAVALVALLTTAAGYGIGLVKVAPRATRWARAARRMVPALLGLAGVALVAVIVGELLATLDGEAVAISGPALVAVAATLLGAAVAAVVAAVVPGRDPLGLPERRRTAYVYAAEAMLALLVLHVRLTMPWLFSGFFSRYWPLIVLGLAFAGVGLGELFRRQGRWVLADPLGRTGAMLPVLPLLGALWMEPAPGEDTLFLVLAGGLYATLALVRSSTGFGALAALAFNAGLWTVLGRRDGFGLMEHPQFWVVPPALCVLAGAYLNRDRLDATQSAAVRHLAAGAVYLSSTADLILNGVAEDPWLPLVLGGLSLLGILAGIALRVRGFLLLGTAFLGLSVFAMVWYAAVDLRQTWLWAASGIVVGIGILAAFALFEKRRREVLEVVERIKHWQP